MSHCAGCADPTTHEKPHPFCGGCSQEAQIEVLKADRDALAAEIAGHEDMIKGLEIQLRWMTESYVERETEREALREELLAARKALKMTHRMFGHNHWDSTMQHGTGCEKCIEQITILDVVRKAEGQPHLARLLEQETR